MGLSEVRKGFGWWALPESIRHIKIVARGQKYFRGFSMQYCSIFVEINLILIEEYCSWIGKDVMKNRTHKWELKSKSLNFAIIVECETESNHISDSGNDISFWFWYWAFIFIVLFLDYYYYFFYDRVNLGQEKPWVFLGSQSKRHLTAPFLVSEEQQSWDQARKALPIWSLNSISILWPSVEC